MVVDIAIICPIETEFKVIRNILEKPISFGGIEENLVFDFGQIKGDHFTWNVAIVEPSFDTSSFEMNVNNILRSLKPKYAFLAGIAGGIKDVEIGDIVIGTKAYGYESGKETASGFVSRPNAIKNDHIPLLNLTKRIVRGLQEENTSKPDQNLPEFYFGPIASGNKVIAASKSETYHIIKKHYNDTLAVELESYSFALLCSRFKISYLNIRGISDLIDGKSKSDAEGHQEKSSEQVALLLERLITKLPFRQQDERHAFDIHFTQNRFSAIQWRNPKEGKLLFKDDYIALVEKEEITRLRNLEKVEHVKMGGELFKNWVKVSFQVGDKSLIYYFSNLHPLGLGYLVGGSKRLFNQFKQYEKKQVKFYPSVG